MFISPAIKLSYVVLCTLRGSAARRCYFILNLLDRLHSLLEAQLKIYVADKGDIEIIKKKVFYIQLSERIHKLRFNRNTTKKNWDRFSEFNFNLNVSNVQPFYIQLYIVHLSLDFIIEYGSIYLN